MSSIPGGSHPFIIAARWLRLVGNRDYRSGPGGAPKFELCEPDALLGRLATVVKEDGSLNGKSPYAERFAICLANNRNSVEAAQLFEAIIEGEDSVLFLIEPKQKVYVAEAVADRPGKLGYEGVYRFAILAMASRQTDLAKRLFQEIVEKVPTECYPIRLQDIRVAALMALKSMKVEHVVGVPIDDVLEQARARSY